MTNHYNRINKEYEETMRNGEGDIIPDDEIWYTTVPTHKGHRYTGQGAIKVGDPHRAFHDDNEQDGEGDTRLEPIAASAAIPFALILVILFSATGWLVAIMFYVMLR